ncbi:ABC transporter, ATP-binding protein [Pseudonocardia sp. Ae263_Ps1]|nr:ABC transporter, ATP-binding protein [Pseudonocardia sp. Ae150A_Ps1]OLL84393.1 ABC transporter, ATP-binding protein [Pseudonocardia sp. Ae263_Ps1]OLL95589.1 ABC transporter, ATP-binding protein [Pseudonocardia sp. Ae356_Ps1]
MPVPPRRAALCYRLGARPSCCANLIGELGAVGQVEVVVRLVGIHHTHASGTVALRGVDLDVDPAVATVLRGGNGAGKSTLLRIAAGAVVPTAGAVEDRPAVVGYLPDRFPATMKIPPRRWLDHLARVRGLEPDDLLDRADELLTELGYDGDDDEPMAELSKGNTQKIGLVQALVCDPGALVLDEPWSGLDDDAADALTRLLAGRTGATLVTDHTGTALELPGARVHRLREGRIATDADPESVPLPAAPPPGAMMRIDLACAGDPRPLIEQVLPPARVEGAAPGRFTVRVPAPEADAWLAAALSAGCAVRSVRPVRTERPRDGAPSGRTPRGASGPVGDGPGAAPQPDRTPYAEAHRAARPRRGARGPAW